MNNITKFLGMGCLALAAFTSCIDEVEPTSVATTDQINNSNAGTSGIVMALPAKFNIVWDEDRHYSFGYGAMMRIRDVMTGDFHMNSTSYDHWKYWAQNKHQGDSYIFSQFIWNYYWGFVMTANNVISTIDPETASESQLGDLGVGYAYRAMLYLDLARLYEFLPCDVFPDGLNEDGQDVTNLTVPIVSETTSEEAARNNPRVTRQEMAEFILSDLQKAEQYIVNLKSTKDNVLPDLACVYGLQARYYMWLANDGKVDDPDCYAKAKAAARKAIETARVQPMTEEECLNTSKGFNDPLCWMWASTMNSENRSVTTGIINWASWMCNQTSFGYTGSGTGIYSMMDASLYKSISNTDFRKYMYKCSDKATFRDKIRLIPGTEELYAEMEEGAALKFRPGSGDCEDYTKGAATSFPIMRVEEMYLIEAEAAAHLDAGEGKILIENFMINYRDPAYSCKNEDVVDEIFQQKRVEFWGEGLTFFDIKRLNKSVVRNYSGTKWPDKLTRFNTEGRPAWMNFVIVRTEANNNAALKGMNNPDPSDAYAK